MATKKKRQFDSALAVMAKVPIPGQVKTRLCPPLTPESACELYSSFLKDKVTHAGSTPGCDLFVCYTPDDQRAQISKLLPNCSLLAQEGDDLGERMANCAKRLFSEGYENVVIVDADTPTLPPIYFALAFRSLAQPETDVVIGPSHDGGYYLIGMGRPQPRLFEDITWSSFATLRETVKRANELDLNIRYLPYWQDVDDEKELKAVATEFSNASVCNRAPNTLACLAKLKLL
jgi:uncharacterized protein